MAGDRNRNAKKLHSLENANRFHSLNMFTICILIKYMEVSLLTNVEKLHYSQMDSLTRLNKGRDLSRRSGC